MTTILVVTVIFALAMILITKVPVGIEMNKLGGYDNRLPREQQAKLSGFGRRAMGAHENTIEAFPVIVAAVALVLATGKASELTTKLCWAIMIARSLYVICYWFDWHLARTTVWFVSLVSCVWMMLQALPA